MRNAGPCSTKGRCHCGRPGLQACKGYWYAATVLAVSDDSVPQYLVKFRGFPAAQNESVPKNRIRQNLTKAQIVERRIHPLFLSSES